MSGRGADGWEMLPRRIWLDPAFTALDSDAKVLFLWSWTGPSNALCGLYHVSPRMLEHAFASRNGSTPRDPGVRDRVRAALRELAVKPLALYDDDNEVLWVVNRMKYANRSPKVAVLLRREVEECPPSPLRDEFLRRYGDRIQPS